MLCQRAVCECQPSAAGAPRGAAQPLCSPGSCGQTLCERRRRSCIVWNSPPGRPVARSASGRPGGGFHTMHESTSGRPTAAARPIRRPFAQTLRLSALTTCVVFGCIITIRAVASTSTATVAGVCSVRKDKVLPWLRVATSLHDLLLN